MGQFWKDHGTKVLGGVTALLGTLAVLTPDQAAVYGIDAHTALRIAAIATGLGTIIRGFTNSANQGK